MGYDIHITRKENAWDHDAALEISLKEWENLVANDPELEIDPSSAIALKTGEIKVYKWEQKSDEKLSFKNWIKTIYNTSKASGWFFGYEGDIWTKKSKQFDNNKNVFYREIIECKSSG